ncbi:MAG: hypothetical protein AB1540_13755 [Bdellovibrionota bacterium]
MNTLSAGWVRLMNLAFLVASVFFVESAGAARYYEEWNLASLQKKYAKAMAIPTPWIGYWWPYREGGINNGLNDADGLSAAAKLDRVFGKRNWVSGWEYNRHGKGRRSPDWWGHCNGWAVAAIMEAEPRSDIDVKGVRFGVRDRKAILSEYWMESGSDFIGNRVWSAKDTSSRAFWDVVPAQFHLAMTNIVGRQGRSVIIDRYTGYEIWNQPVVAYEIKPIREDDYLGRDPRYRNLYRVNVETTLWWANDEVDPDEITPEFQWEEDDFFSKRTLRYELWVDAPLEFDSSGNLASSGNIVLTNQGTGGRWKNGSTYNELVNSHPDYIWIPLSYARSSGFKNPRINDAWVRANIAAEAN